MDLCDKFTRLEGTTKDQAHHGTKVHQCTRNDIQMRHELGGFGADSKLCLPHSDQKTMADLCRF